MLLCGVISFSGCSVIENIEAANNEKLLNKAKKSCLGYGFRESTDNFSSCVQKEVNETKGRHAIATAASKVKGS